MASTASPQASVMVANSVAMEVGTNNIVIMGAFDGLQSAVYPARTTFYAVAKLWGMSGKDNTCTLKLVDTTNDQVVAEAGEHKFTSNGPTDIHTAISLFQNVSLPKSGTYEARAYMGDKVIGAYPITAGSAAGAKPQG
ncbi:MAG TPA: hypothetical protein VD973_21330 [Symbiobacteriaceae bacterium]|jgi:hypothetical protein|nr:hypothetical protein [Symbiobacteriaceae bacterium]